MRGLSPTVGVGSLFSMVSAPEGRLRNALRRIDELARGRPLVGLAHDDADEVEGTIACDDAVGFDPLPLLRFLDESGAPRRGDRSGSWNPARIDRADR